MRHFIGVATLVCLVVGMPNGWAQQPTAIPVGTLAAELRPITKTTDFVGRVEAIERVEIRARVTGFLQDILFKEGATVKEGDILYRIEPESFQAAVQQAQGALYEAQGKFANATAQRGRTEELVKTAAASRALLDERVGNEKEAQGQVVTADANLKTATVNLGYTEIVAPISGQVGRSKLTKGNVVGPDSGPLTVIVSRDPMYVTFPVSQREFLKVDYRGLEQILGEWAELRGVLGLEKVPDHSTIQKAAERLLEKGGPPPSWRGRCAARGHAA